MFHIKSKLDLAPLVLCALETSDHSPSICWIFRRFGNGESHPFSCHHQAQNAIFGIWVLVHEQTKGSDPSFLTAKLRSPLAKGQLPLRMFLPFVRQCVGSITDKPGVVGRSQTA